MAVWIVWVSIFVVTNTIFITVCPLCRIIRELVLVILHAVIVAILVCIVTNAIPVGVLPLFRINWEGIHIIVVAISIAILICIVTDAIPIGILPLVGVIRKSILGVYNTISILVGWRQLLLLGLTCVSLNHFFFPIGTDGFCITFIAIFTHQVFIQLITFIEFFIGNIITISVGFKCFLIALSLVPFCQLIFFSLFLRRLLTITLLESLCEGAIILLPLWVV